MASLHALRAGLYGLNYKADGDYNDYDGDYDYTNVTDACGHGTHVAGTVMARPP